MLNSTDLMNLASALGGLLVQGCLPSSPAQRAGVRYGDILLSVDGIPTPTWQAYVAAREQSGASLRLRLFRQGTEIEVDVPLDREATLDTDAVISALSFLHGDASQSADSYRGPAQELH